MNKTLIGGLAFIASLGIATSAQAATMFKAELSGDKIVDADGNPAPTGSSGTGFAHLTLNDAKTELAYELTLNGLGLESEGGTVQKIHFHTGFANQRSPFHVLNIFGPADDLDSILVSTADSLKVSGIWDDTDFCFSPPTPMGGPQTCEGNNDTTKKLSDYVDELVAGGLYINIHTSTQGTGEIRGQIESVPESGSVLGLVTVLGLAGLSSRKKNLNSKLR